MREAVRNGRRGNFYITENSFIDHYAREAGLGGIAVYHVLERYANCDTRSTWIGTARMAKLLDLSQRSVQRHLKTLEDLGLIRIVRTETTTTYFVMPVPPRPKTATIPLFDQVPDSVLQWDDTGVAEATSASQEATAMSHGTTRLSREASAESRIRDTDDVAYKEEQNLLNKTHKQDLFNNIFEQPKPDTRKTAERILEILGLSPSLVNATMAAVELEVKRTKLSTDGVVQRICTAANLGERRGVPRDRFLEDFVSQTSAQEIVEELNLPATSALVSTVMAAVKAEVKDTGLPVGDVTAKIIRAASEDRRKGIAIDRFYFENVKWRSHVRVSKAEQRKLDNLEVNARVKQRLREKLGVS